jgi:hypothetical protein
VARGRRENADFDLPGIRRIEMEKGAKVVICTVLEREQHEKLRRLAYQGGVSMASIIRKAIQSFLKGGGNGKEK